MSPGPLVLLGIGLGGFIDGIVLHQILQWHHMISALEPPSTLAQLQRNTLADGIFHAATWVFVFAGLTWLARQWTPRRTLSVKRLSGGLLAGWGAFNLTDGVLNHHLLEIHHIRDGHPAEAAYDIGFLVLGAVLLLLGERIIAATTSE